jgi:hypothetical protein
MKPNIYMDSNNTRFFIVHDERTEKMKVHGDNGG